MKDRTRFLLAVAACALLSGCLEVAQYPPWRHGEYDGKDDNLPQQRFFAGDRLAWFATVINRNWLQDEYPRTAMHGARYD